jgi:hypothetical protein
MKTYENFINKPIIKYYPNGQKWFEEWWLNGELHREDGPAIQFWRKNGQKEKEVWKNNGKDHRKDGPARQYWYSNGQKKIEIWLLNKKWHRENGPAYQDWSENGKKLFEQWFLNNKEYSREEWVEELKTIGSPHYLEQKMLLNTEKYNL